MAYRAKRYCIICGDEIPQKRRKKDTCCIRCGIEKNLITVDQMRKKSGVFYDRWADRITGGIAKREANRKRKKRKDKAKEILG